MPAARELLSNFFGSRHDEKMLERWGRKLDDKNMLEQAGALLWERAQEQQTLSSSYMELTRRSVKCLEKASSLGCARAGDLLRLVQGRFVGKTDSQSSAVDEPSVLAFLEASNANAQLQHDPATIVEGAWSLDDLMHKQQDIEEYVREHDGSYMARTYLMALRKCVDCLRAAGNLDWSTAAASLAMSYLFDTKAVRTDDSIVRGVLSYAESNDDAWCLVCRYYAQNSIMDPAFTQRITLLNRLIARCANGPDRRLMPILYEHRGCMRGFQMHWSQAVADFEMALKLLQDPAYSLWPNDPEEHFPDTAGLGLSEFRWRAAMQAEMNKNIGTCAQHLPDDAKAERCLRAFVEASNIDSDRLPQSWYELGQLALLKSDLPEARRCLEKGDLAVKAVPSFIRTRGEDTRRVFKSLLDMLAANPKRAQAIASRTEQCRAARGCWACGKLQKLQRCSGCGIAAYCSPSCQKHDWKKHKPVCGPRAE
ncbi:unnamed protein product [Polarella glacialis]|uniref:MYND-type domain-containing protein n=1 Tax=Polarella glacialis TaxID=89957 RepID=A0A813D8V1_POLGL|nr:unnamed protein product [Polarella glacialis]